MSSDLEGVGTALLNGQVPDLWRARSYPSLKPLASYVAHLNKRLAMLERWYEKGKPVVFWLPGFFFTQSFCTAVKQNYARKHSYAIDTLGFDFEVLRQPAMVTAPRDGAYVDGLFIEGAKWDREAWILGESEPKQLTDEMPILWMKVGKLDTLSSYSSFECPLYREASRRGVLTTTGHSTNFVMDVKLPSSLPAKHWVKRGVAMLLELPE
jgi:dynein heavy chain